MIVVSIDSSMSSQKHMEWEI